MKKEKDDAVLKLVEACVVEGPMAKLARWMVKTYLPKHSVYKTRPSMKGVVRRSKEEIRRDSSAEQEALVDVMASAPSYEPPTPSVEVIAQAREELQNAPLYPEERLNPYDEVKGA